MSTFVKNCGTKVVILNFEIGFSARLKERLSIMNVVILHHLTLVTPLAYTKRLVASLEIK